MVSSVVWKHVKNKESMIITEIFDVEIHITNYKRQVISRKNRYLEVRGEMVLTSNTWFLNNQFLIFKHLSLKKMWWFIRKIVWKKKINNKWTIIWNIFKTIRNSQELRITSYKSIRTQANSYKDLLAIMLRIIFCKTLKVGKNIYK